VKAGLYIMAAPGDHRADLGGGGCDWGALRAPISGASGGEESRADLTYLRQQQREGGGGLG
jgi:hypothetical protein